MMIKTLAALGALAMAAAPAVAETASANNEFSFAFRFQPSALNSVAGAQNVHADLNAAANAACRRGSPSALRGVDAACKADLLDAAVAKISNPNLSQVHGDSSRFARVRGETVSQ